MATEFKSYSLGACWLKAHITLSLEVKSRVSENALGEWTKAGEKIIKSIENNNIWILNDIDFSFIMFKARLAGTLSNLV